MKKRIYSILMVAVMLFSMLPAFGAAAESEAPAVNGAYTNGVWAAGGNGSTTYNVDGTNVTLSKTAVPIEGMENTFDITLEVHTSQSSTTAEGAVILVIDVSGSMDFCSECGAEGYHSRDCEYYTLFGYNGVTNRQTRIYTAEQAAHSFLESYAGTDATANRQLAIVTFARNSAVALDWTNVAGGTGANGYDRAYAAIDRLSAGGGTNLEAGLYSALGLLNRISSKSENVILLTDGSPTYRINGGSGTAGSASNNRAAANQATSIKNGGAALYTVCYGAADEVTYTGGPTVGNFLKNSIASSNMAYTAANMSELETSFAAITDKINSGLSGEGWTVTDPMADRIQVVSVPSKLVSVGNDTYEWTLNESRTVFDGNVTHHYYTCTYRVELDVQSPGFEENTYYPTNEPTYLTIEGVQYAFPVPGVRGVLPRTQITVSKQWDDDGNRDAIRPDSVTVQLQKDGVNHGNPVTLSGDNNWTYTWIDLIEKSGGVLHNYTVVEVVPEGYTASTVKEGNTITLTNTHVPAKVSVSGSKTWEDANNQDGIRPESITINLLKNGTVMDTVTVTEADGWAWSFENLAKYEDGVKITYSITEEAVDGYTTEVNDYNVTNTHTPEVVTVAGSKTWNDGNNQDGIRPESITINLLKNGTVMDTVTVTEADGWAWSFENLAKYEAGVEITYTITEEAVDGYTTEVNGYNVTNTHTPEVVTVAGSKTWNDGNNQDGIRPESITINLLKNGTVMDTITVTEANGWAWSFENLAKYEAGVEITYTITEKAVDGYTTEVNGYNVTNTHTPEVVTVAGSKTWNDGNNQDGIRPESITINLLKNGTVMDTITVTEADGWAWSFENLAKYEAGVEITYTITEEAVEGYTTEVNGYNVTNTHTPEVVTVAGSKTWNDGNNQDGIRPESITINLLKNGTVVNTITVTEADGWAWSFENLAKYEAGVEITYTITEEAVEGYTTEVNGYNVTNTHTPEVVTVAGSKTWNDGNNQDGIRPESITINLLKNGIVIDTVSVTEANGWAWSFENLAKYEAGVEITYTITEEAVEGYTTEVNGYNVTNTHTPEVVTVAGSKTWNDGNNQDGIRPESITINLLKNGTVVNTITVTEADGWAWSFENLAKYEAGVEITYTITEEAVEGYTTEVNGYNVTNTHTPEVVTVAGSKTWNDGNNQDGIRPESITINLLKNGIVIDTVSVTEANGWAWSFENLAKYEAGVEITYTITEEAVEGYTTEVNGYNVTNTHTPEVVTVAGSKTWNDGNNQDGIRPESITINLLKNGTVVNTITVTEANGWAWSFENLAKYEAGVEITYTITEEAVEGYTTEVNGYNVTNTHTPEVVTVAGSKTWNDGNNQDGIRPESITINLLKNGTVVNTITVTEADGWAWSFENLAKYEAGVEITYTITEEAVEGYTTEVNGYNVTNTHTPELINISVVKFWADKDNKEGKRPEQITIRLHANGNEIGSLVITAQDDWAGAFRELPKYENGVEIKYTISEDEIEYYRAAIRGSAKNGFTVTNSCTYIPQTGDTRNAALWMGLLTMSLLGFAVTFVADNKKRRAM